MPWVHPHVPAKLSIGCLCLLLIWNLGEWKWLWNLTFSNNLFSHMKKVISFLIFLELLEEHPEWLFPPPSQPKRYINLLSPAASKGVLQCWAKSKGSIISLLFVNVVRGWKSSVSSRSDLIVMRVSSELSVYEVILEQDFISGVCFAPLQMITSTMINGALALWLFLYLRIKNDLFGIWLSSLGGKSRRESHC